MTTKEKSLDDLFLETLKDIYFAEKTILRALPKMAKAARSDQLRQAFEHHHEETEGQVERLERIFDLMDKPARGKTCEANPPVPAPISKMRRPRPSGNFRADALTAAAMAAIQWLVKRPSP